MSKPATCPKIACVGVNEHVEGGVLGILDNPRVNVLALNMALDRVAGRAAAR